MQKALLYFPENTDLKRSGFYRIVEFFFLFCFVFSCLNKRNKTKLFSSKMLMCYIYYYTSYIIINKVINLKFLTYIPKIMATSKKNKKNSFLKYCKYIFYNIYICI